MSDQQLADSMYGKFYSDVPREQFDKKIGLQTSPDTSLGNQLGLTARYAAEGAMALPNMIGNAANTAINLGSQGINKVAGTKIPMLGMPSESTPELLNKIGLPNPQGAQQNIVGDMSRALVGTGSVIGGAKSLANAIPEISSLAQNAVMQARGAIGSSGAASGTKEAGGGQIAQTLAGLVGGIASTRQPFSRNDNGPRNFAADIKDDARDSYADANQSGAVLNKNVSAFVPKIIENDFSKTGKMNARLHGDTLSVLDDLKNDAENGNLSLEQLHQYRQLFSDVVQKNLHPNGSLQPDAMKANQAIDAIDSVIESAGQNPGMLSSGSPDAIAAWQKAQGLWKQSAQVNDIERIMNRADMFEQPATALRTGFRTLANNPKRMNAYSQDLQALIRRAATISMPVEVLRGLGSRLISAVMAGTGNIAGSVLAQGASAIPRNIATQMQMRRGQGIIDSIARPNSLMQPMKDFSSQYGIAEGLLPVESDRQ